MQSTGYEWKGRWGGLNGAVPCEEVRCGIKLAPSLEPAIRSSRMSENILRNLCWFRLVSSFGLIFVVSHRRVDVWASFGVSYRPTKVRSPCHQHERPKLVFFNSSLFLSSAQPSSAKPKAILGTGM